MNFNKVVRDFISSEKREFKFKIGKLLASSLAGFLAGAVVATIILVTAYLAFIANGSL